MADRDTLAAIPVIDCDSHVSEPADLWTSRLPAKHRDAAPRVETRADGTQWWLLPETGAWLTPVGVYARANWPEAPPSFPKTFDEMDPGAWRAEDRLARLDEYGVTAQVLYPNLIGFQTYQFLAHDDPGFALACTQAYNDFLTDFASADPDRLLPITMVPFWDVDAAVAEMRRCREAGHRGALFANKYERIGLPEFTDEHWDPVYATAQDLDWSINFHIGFTPTTDDTIAESIERRMAEADYDRRAKVRSDVAAALGNADPISRIVTSGLCDRFPRVKFVSVESGFGYLPYLMDTLDYHWRIHDVADRNPGSLLPSEYFRRQCYGSFWFETRSLELLAGYADNVMFETDYPHPTSLSPGRGCASVVPSEHIAAAFAGVPDDVARKALHDTAAAVYHVDP